MHQRDLIADSSLYLERMKLLESSISFVLLYQIAMTLSILPANLIIYLHTNIICETIERARKVNGKQPNPENIISVAAQMAYPKRK